MNHAAAGDDAVRIFGHACELCETAYPVSSRVRLVPNFPVPNVGMSLQVGSIIRMPCNRRDPSFPCRIRPGAVCTKIAGRGAFPHPSSYGRELIITGCIHRLRRCPRRSSGQRVHDFSYTITEILGQHSIQIRESEDSCSRIDRRPLQGRRIPDPLHSITDSGEISRRGICFREAKHRTRSQWR